MLSGFGLDVARVILARMRADVTPVYAEIEQQEVVSAMKRVDEWRQRRRQTGREVMSRADASSWSIELGDTGLEPVTSSL